MCPKTMPWGRLAFRGQGEGQRDPKEPAKEPEKG